MWRRPGCVNAKLIGLATFLKTMRALVVPAAVVIVFITAAEAALHFVPKLRPLPRTYVGEHSSPGRRGALVADPVIGWRYDASRVFGRPIQYRTNSSGFRSEREFIAPSPKRGDVVALIGDSFTFGLGIEYAETFGAIIESRLRRPSVYNFGIMGFGMDQMWLTLRAEALPLKPSLVIVTFISGDFTRTQEAFRPWEGFTKPVYTLRDGALVPQTRQDVPGPFLRFFDKHSSVLRVGRLAMRTFAHHFPVGEWWNLNAAVLDQIRADCAVSDVPVVFVYIPTKEWQQFPSLRDYMRRTHANFIDMTVGNQLPIEGTTLPDGHLNATGNRKVANAIAEWMDSRRDRGLSEQIPVSVPAP